MTRRSVSQRIGKGRSRSTRTRSEASRVSTEIAASVAPVVLGFGETRHPIRKSRTGPVGLPSLNGTNATSYRRAGNDSRIHAAPGTPRPGIRRETVCRCRKGSREQPRAIGAPSSQLSLPTCNEVARTRMRTLPRGSPGADATRLRRAAAPRRPGCRPIAWHRRRQFVFELLEISRNHRKAANNSSKETKGLRIQHSSPTRR